MKKLVHRLLAFSVLSLGLFMFAVPANAVGLVYLVVQKPDVITEPAMSVLFL